MIKISIRSKIKSQFGAQKTGFRKGATLREATERLRIQQARGPIVGGKGVFREQRARFGTSSIVGRAKNALTRVRARIPSRLRLR